MTSRTTNPLLAPFLSTAATVAFERPEVDADMIREIFLEAATVLHNGLAIDGLDQHDTAAVVDGLCVELCAADPGAALRARAEAVLNDGEDLHDPDGVAGAYLMSAAMLGV